MSEPFREYLFEYPYQGDLWSITIKAAGPNDAIERLKALAWAGYRGEIVETGHVSSPRFPLALFKVWYRNWCARSAA